MQEKKESLISDLNNQNNGQSIDFEIPEYLEKRNVDYSSILLDLQTCEKALLQLKKRNSEIVKTALFTTVIVLYGKCFTDSSLSKSTKLEAKIFENEEAKLRDLHLELMHSRHNFIAHRGFSEHEYGKAFFHLDLKEKTWGIKVGIQKRFNFEKKDIPEYLYLIEFVINIVKEKFTKTQLKTVNYIYENMFKNGMNEGLKMIKSEEINYTELIDSKLKE